MDRRGQPRQGRREVGERRAERVAGHRPHRGGDREGQGVTTVTYEPLNRETPAAGFYVRNHFPAPQIDAASWRLALPGGAHATLATLARLPQREVAAVLE